MIYIGIDPGLTGAVAFLRVGEAPAFLRMTEYEVFDMPTVALSNRSRIRREVAGADLAEIIAFNATGSADLKAIAMIERVSAMPKQGVASMFSLGRSFGVASGVCHGLGIPVMTVPPQVWKAAFNIGKDKSASLSVARELFPDLKKQLSLAKHHGRAEALLLAAHCRSIFKKDF